ncbi:MAG: DUF2975 domain-containing protein [Bacteroidia bacterium]|nr:DUF2975 domain-containing protein [Bacteroidia bacterium]
MKASRSNFKLIALSVLAIIAYGFMIVYTVARDMDDFYTGYDRGSSQAMLENDEIETPLKDVYYLNLKPKAGHRSFPDSIQNLTTNTYTHFRSHYIKAETAFDSGLTQKIIRYQIAQGVVSFLMMILMFWIPILFFRFIASLMNEIIFDHKNIRMLRRLGFIILTFYAGYFIFEWCSLKMNRILFEFENYKIVFSNDAQFIWVVIGIVVLLFAEILSRGNKLKEEQELTI